MKVSVQLTTGIESLFGTRDENIRLIESGLEVKTRITSDAIEIEGEDEKVLRAENILVDYAALLREGHVFQNGDLNSYLRVVVSDPTVTLRSLVHSGRQRAFGKKTLAPKTINQRRYIDAIERHDLTFGIGPAGTGKTYLAVAMAKKSAGLFLRGLRSKLEKSWAFCRARCKKRSIHTCGHCTMRFMT
jgi:phosphate starvation-inducible PhoH-like protein